MGRAAVRAAEAVNYTSAGTIEFLLDRNGEFYFMEMNTRIQVEHPITEEVTRIDIVKEQIKIAAGEPLSFQQKDIRFMGHAIECRINAEDPDNDFKPNPGRVTAFHMPGGPGIRIDSHIYNEYMIPPFYDSLLAKLIAWGRNREEAIARLKRALDEFVIEGVKTTIPFHQEVISSEAFKQGDFGTNFIENWMAMYLKI